MADQYQRFPHLFIRSVESFERKLEDAQKSLNISSRDYIPVMYVEETDWTNELLRYWYFMHYSYFMHYCVLSVHVYRITSAHAD